MNAESKKAEIKGLRLDCGTCGNRVKTKPAQATFGKNPKVVFMTGEPTSEKRHGTFDLHYPGSPDTPELIKKLMDLLGFTPDDVIATSAIHCKKAELGSLQQCGQFCRPRVETVTRGLPVICFGFIAYEQMIMLRQFATKNIVNWPRSEKTIKQYPVSYEMNGRWLKPKHPDPNWVAEWHYGIIKQGSNVHRPDVHPYIVYNKGCGYMHIPWPHMGVGSFNFDPDDWLGMSEMGWNRMLAESEPALMRSVEVRK